MCVKILPVRIVDFGVHLDELALLSTYSSLHLVVTLRIPMLMLVLRNLQARAETPICIGDHGHYYAIVFLARGQMGKSHKYQTIHLWTPLLKQIPKMVFSAEEGSRGCEAWEALVERYMVTNVSVMVRVAIVEELRETDGHRHLLNNSPRQII